MDNKQVQNFNKFLSVFDPDYMTKKDFVKQWEMVVKQIKKVEKQLIDSINRIDNRYTAKQNELKKNSDVTVSDVKRIVKEEIGRLKKAHSDLSANIELKLAEVRDGIDGKDADDEAIYNRLLSELPKKEDIAKSIPVLGERVRDALELLDGEERLMPSAIKGLEEKLKELDDKPLGGGGGGFSKIHMDRHIIENETPSGTKNGTNKAFTLAKAPNPVASLKLYWNGQLLLAGSDYTLSKNTITMEEAPDSGDNLWADYRI